MPNLVTRSASSCCGSSSSRCPVELEEAARIDGCSRLGVLVKIVLPLSGRRSRRWRLIILLWTWNDFLWPLVVINTQSHMTLQLGLSTSRARTRPTGRC